MKHKELLDIILHALYKLRHHDEGMPDLLDVLAKENIQTSRSEMFTIAERLLKENLVRGSIHGEGASLKITSEGIEYCEETSFNKPETPLIEQYQFRNIQQVNIQQGSGNKMVNKNVANRSEQIETIERLLQKHTLGLSEEMSAYFKELKTSVKNDKKPGERTIVKLRALAADLITIGSVITGSLPQ